MAGYSFRLSGNVSDGHLCSFKTGYFKCIFFSLFLLASSTFLKKGVARGKQSNQWDRETSDWSRNIFFPVEEPIYSLLYFPTLMFSTLAWKQLHQLLERSREMPVWENAKMSWWSSFTGLRQFIWNWTPVSLDASRKSHSSQVLVPEDFPTIPPCKRFPRLLVIMMLRMFSKIFFTHNPKCFHIYPKSTFTRHLCDSGLKLLQKNWSC